MKLSAYFWPPLRPILDICSLLCDSPPFLAACERLLLPLLPLLLFPPPPEPPEPPLLLPPPPDPCPLLGIKNSKPPSLLLAIRPPNIRFATSVPRKLGLLI